MLYNSRNLLHYFRFSMTLSPSDADIISVSPQMSLSPELRNLPATVPEAVTNTVSGVSEGVLIALGILAPERRDLGGGMTAQT